jgi:glycosyltransferase involved in cell wall biosynthesis
MYSKDITVVIPAKDEEKSIDRCIESIFAALEGKKRFEIILVDSYSSDRTVEIAKKYPIRILRLKKHWPKSPAAGRYIGAVNSNGKYVLFLDADMTLEKKWISKGLKVLESDEKIAGVTGVMYSYLYGQNLGEGRRIHMPFGIVSFLPGAGLYKRGVLEEVGHFNPFMRGFEERELGARIKNRGYKQLSINEVISRHYEKARDFKELHEKATYFIGVGQFLRIHFSLKNIFKIIRIYFLIFTTQLLMILYVLAIFYYIFFGNILFISILLSICFVMIITFAIRQRNIKKPLWFLCSNIASSVFLFKGLLMNHKEMDSYPLNVEVIK